jgi:hypothetical protein
VAFFTVLPAPLLSGLHKKSISIHILSGSFRRRL